MNEKHRWIKDVLWFLAFAGALSIVFRLWAGLGATTNLSDAVPWGLWKIMNMVAGVALATGGFTIGFLVYGLRLERFRPLVKPAILIAFLGYGSSVFALVMDIGLPYRIWHPLVMWNHHSFLFEVAWCVMLYFTVTILELSPTFLERLHLGKLSDLLHRFAPGIVIVGIALSSLHHSSLGSLFLVTPQRLHPLWYTPMIPVHFILSAMGAGMMVVVLVRLLYARWYEGGAVSSDDQTFDTLRRLASIAAAVLGLYLVVVVFGLASSGTWRHLAAGTWESWLYGIEVLAATVVPITLVCIAHRVRSPGVLSTAAAFAACGLVLNRLNVGIFGYLRDAHQAYLPSPNEWALSLGVIAAAGLVFFYVVENYAIFDDSWQKRRRARSEFMPAFDRASHVWQRALGSELNRATLAAVFALPLAWALLYPPFHAENASDAAPARPPVALDVERAVLQIDGNQRGLTTRFPHREHQDRLGGKESCGRCHHLSLPGDHSTPCSRCHRDMERGSDIFRHATHFAAVAAKENLDGWIPANHSCTFCHEAGTVRGAESAKPCLDCHRKDMTPTREIESPFGMARANGYRAAMHDNCIGCHRESRERVSRPDLDRCSTCHESLRGRPGPVTASSMDDLIAAVR